MGQTRGGLRKGHAMKRFAITLAAAVTIALAGSGAALCQSVSTNPGTSNGGPAQTNQSGTAGAITGGLFADACGP